MDNSWKTYDLSIADWTVGETPSTPSGCAANHGTVEYWYSDSEEGTYGKTIPTMPGTYWVKGVVPADNEYKYLEGEPKQFKILSKLTGDNSGVGGGSGSGTGSGNGTSTGGNSSSAGGSGGSSGNGTGDSGTGNGSGSTTNTSGSSGSSGSAGGSSNNGSGSGFGSTTDTSASGSGNGSGNNTNADNNSGTDNNSGSSSGSTTNTSASKPGWQQSNGVWTYVQEDGTPLNDNKPHLLEWEGESGLYVFDEKGNMQKNTWYKTEDGKTMYLSDSGKAVSNNWVKKDGKWYFMDINCSRIEGTKQVCSWNGSQELYKFDENGEMMLGWIKEEDGSWYFADHSGKLVTGWRHLQWNGKYGYYFFDSNSKLLTNQMVGPYYVDASGHWVE